MKGKYFRPDKTIRERLEIRIQIKEMIERIVSNKKEIAKNRRIIYKMRKFLRELKDDKI